MLTDIQVRQKRSACKLADSHGLLLEVTSAGSKKWRYRVCPGGREFGAVSFFEVESVKFQGEIVKLTEAHRSRFCFAGFSTWPEPKHG